MRVRLGMGAMEVVDKGEPKVMTGFWFSRD